MWHFSKSMGKRRPTACLGLGISFPPNVVVSLLYLVPLLVILSLASVSILALCDGAEVT